jgi:hypothetical protein
VQQRMPQHNIRVLRSASDATAKGVRNRPPRPRPPWRMQQASPPRARAAPRCTGKTRLRGTSLLRHLAAARVHLDQDPGHRFRMSTDRRHLMFQRLCHASTLRKPADHWVPTGTVLGDPPFPYAIRQSRLPLPHDGEGRRRTHRHSEEKPAAILSHAIPESPRHLEQARGTTRPKCSFRIHLDCHDRPVGHQVEQFASVASLSGRELQMTSRVA